MKTFKEYNTLSKQGTPRTLEQRLNFDYGFKIGKEYHVQFIKNGMKRDAGVIIPNRGYPIVIIKEKNGILESFKIVKDIMQSSGSISRPYDIEQFDKLMKEKPTEVPM